MDNQAVHVMTIANSIIGVSIIAMPYCFKQCGIILSVIILIISSIISRLSCHLLLKSAIIARRRTFEFLAFHAFGPLGKFIIEIGLIGFLLGTCIAFFVVMGDLGPAIVAKMTGARSTDTLRTSMLMALALFCVLPLGLLRNIDSLSSVCTATIGFYFCLVLKIIFQSVPHIFSGDWIDKVELWRPAGFLQCLPIFSMALFCQTQIFEIYQAIPNASLDKMNDLIRAAVNICTGVYIFVGIFGYVAFCDQQFTGNILMSFPSSLVSEVIKIGFVLSVAFSFPLIIFPCRASLYSLLYRQTYSVHETVDKYIPEGRFKGLTFLIVFVSLVTGVMIPNIELVLGLVGSTIGIMICVLFPAMCFICVSIKNTNERILAQLMLFIGVIVMVLGTYANLYAVDELPRSPVTDKIILPDAIRLDDPSLKVIDKPNTAVPVVPINIASKPEIKEAIKEARQEPPQPEEPPEMKNVVKEARQEPPQPEEPPEVKNVAKEARQEPPQAEEPPEVKNVVKEARQEPPQPEEPREVKNVVKEARQEPPQPQEPREVKNVAKEMRHEPLHAEEPPEVKNVVEEARQKVAESVIKAKEVHKEPPQPEEPVVEANNVPVQKSVKEEAPKDTILEKPVETPNQEKVKKVEDDKAQEKVDDSKVPEAAKINNSNLETKNKKAELVAEEAIEKEDKELLEQEKEKIKEEVKHLELIKNIEKKNAEQKKIMEEKKKILEEIKARQALEQESQQKEIDKVQKEKIKAVEEIEEIAKKAIEKLSGGTNQQATLKPLEVVKTTQNVSGATNNSKTVLTLENLVPMPLAVPNNNISGVLKNIMAPKTLDIANDVKSDDKIQEVKNREQNTDNQSMKKSNTTFSHKEIEQINLLDVLRTDTEKKVQEDPIVHREIRSVEYETKNEKIQKDSQLLLKEMESEGNCDKNEKEKQISTDRPLIKMITRLTEPKLINLKFSGVNNIPLRDLRSHKDRRRK